MKIMSALPRRLFLLLTLASLGLFSGCTGSKHFQEIGEAGVTGVPRFLELHQNLRAATLHFPAGLYTIEATDDAGYYYRAPRRVVEHSYTAVSVQHNGGLYLSREGRRNLRGYIYRAGALTHVGSFSHADFTLQD